LTAALASVQAAWASDRIRVRRTVAEGVGQVALRVRSMIDRATSVERRRLPVIASG
jgi:hypothetical protein